MAKKEKKVWYNLPDSKRKVCLFKGEYSNGTLGIILQTKDGEDWCDLTVNLNCGLQSKYKAFLDTNNFPDAERFVEENGIAEYTGRMGNSGFCSYPLYEFKPEALKNC